MFLYHLQPSIALILLHQREVLCTNKSGFKNRKNFPLKSFAYRHILATKLLGSKTSVLRHPAIRVAQSKYHLVPFLNRRRKSQPVNGTISRNPKIYDRIQVALGKAKLLGYPSTMRAFFK